MRVAEEKNLDLSLCCLRAYLTQPFDYPTVPWILNLGRKQEDPTRPFPRPSWAKVSYLPCYHRHNTLGKVLSVSVGLSVLPHLYPGDDLLEVGVLSQLLVEAQDCSLIP